MIEVTVCEFPVWSTTFGLMVFGTVPSNDETFLEDE